MSGGLLKALRSDSYVELSQYRDQHFRGDNEEQEKLLKKSCTLYVGNLSFYTTEEQIYELFSKSGDIKKIIMGLDKMKKTACGFCFVEYYSRPDAENAMRFINGTRLDDRIIRTDWDAGFKEGRQYGRGRSGGQVRDEYRQDYDAGRGGYGKLAQKQWVRAPSVQRFLPSDCWKGYQNHFVTRSKSMFYVAGNGAQWGKKEKKTPSSSAADFTYDLSAKSYHASRRTRKM